MAAYLLKDVSQVWYEIWRGERSLERGVVDWEELKEDFLDRFFPLKRKEKKWLSL